jgi:hypothetical protein
MAALLPKAFYPFDGLPFLASSDVMRALILAALLPSSLMASYESPDFTVVSSDGVFEIREYPALTLVSTSMQKRGEDGSFMKLFRFIQGRNDRSEKIAMTTPVLMTGTESGTMSFIVPKAVAEKGAPSPSNPEVTIQTVPPSRYAAYRFSGSSKPAAGEAAARKLLAWTERKHFQTEGGAVFAYYNPPWTPWFLRRNEVLIRISPEP